MTDTLRSLSGKLITLLDTIAQADGEITPEQEVLLDQLRETLRRKSDVVGTYLQRLDTRIANIRDEERRLAERRKRFERMVERLEGYVLHVMDATDQLLITGDLHTFGKRTGPPALVIDDASAVAASLPEAVTTEVVQTLDKKRVKDALLAGHEVAGATIERRTFLRRS